jgi:thymidine phosphorylase
LVLDVKVGSGAFMRSVDRARELATTMVELGTAHGVRTAALITDMSTPLGRVVGNAVEVVEAVEVLAGGGPPDVVGLVLALAEEMLEAAGVIGADPAAALADGRAMDVWRAMVRAQGGDPDAPLPVAREMEMVRAPRDGTVTAVDALAVGVAAWRLGAGRARKEDPVSPVAGVLLRRRPGERVHAGEPLLELRTDEASRFPAAVQALRDAVAIGPATGPAAPLIIDRIA